jgi:hypothetical protein
MDRAINTARVYKLLKIMVLALSAFFLIRGVYGVIIYPDFETKMERKYAECEALPYADSCFRYRVAVREQAKEADLNLLIGIGLPIMFFGSNALLNYIAPKKEVKTNG